ncbi:MAG: enoyl-CoA hydratase/isomerase family protein [Pseudomonadales bacterium]
MNYQHLTLRHEGAIATVTFNRPDKANALNPELLAEIETVALSFRDDADARVVIFTGAGRHFSSGADLSGGDGTPAQPLVLRRRRARLGERAVQALYGMDQITIAAWNGAAMGGGACLATALDFRVGAADCFMQYPEIDLGLNLMWQSLPLLIHLVGPARAKRLVAGGDRIGAATLLDWGVLDELVPPGELAARSEALARHYAAKPPVAAQMIKRSVNQVVGALDRALMHMDADQNLLTQTTQDRVAAARAYLEGGEASFRGD